MPVTAPYVLIAAMDVDPEHEALFNEVYDTEHLPAVLQVPGVRAARRLKGEAFTVAVGGVAKEMPAPVPSYSAIYELDDPAVMTSPEWVAAVEYGRWPTEVRPHTKNRVHTLFRTM